MGSRTPNHAAHLRRPDVRRDACRRSRNCSGAPGPASAGVSVTSDPAKLTQRPAGGLRQLPEFQQLVDDRDRVISADAHVRAGRLGDQVGADRLELAGRRPRRPSHHTGHGSNVSSPRRSPHLASLPRGSTWGGLGTVDRRSPGRSGGTPSRSARTAFPVQSRCRRSVGEKAIVSTALRRTAARSRCQPAATVGSNFERRVLPVPGLEGEACRLARMADMVTCRRNERRTSPATAAALRSSAAEM